MPFEQWQKTARKKLYELLGLGYMEKCDFEFKIEHEKDRGSYTEIRFSFQSEPVISFLATYCYLKTRLNPFPL
jgi:hypothetical protein